MKYIRHKKLGFILFEGSVAHIDVANELGGPAEVASAGFVFAPRVEPKCLGHSSTLNLSSAPEDSKALQERINSF